jgi:hypothetical protein
LGVTVFTTVIFGLAPRSSDPVPLLVIDHVADVEAVLALVEKLVGGQGPSQARREKLLRALDDASRHCKDSNQKALPAFFHGLLTGYAVALKLC